MMSPMVVFMMCIVELTVTIETLPSQIVFCKKIWTTFWINSGVYKAFCWSKRHLVSQKLIK